MASETIPFEIPGGAVGELLFLLAAVVGFLFLSKLYVRWPRAERWLVGISLVIFIPAAASLLFVTTNGRAAYSETLPWLVLIAPLLGGLWWLVKTKTTMLGIRPLEAMDAGAIQKQPRSPALTDNPPMDASPPARQSPSERSSQPATKTQQPQGAIASNKIFVSYRRQDSADVTGRIYDRLVQRFDKEQIFKDVDSIPLGVDFREHLRRRHLIDRAAEGEAAFGDRLERCRGIRLDIAAGQRRDVLPRRILRFLRTGAGEDDFLPQRRALVGPVLLVRSPNSLHADDAHQSLRCGRQIWDMLLGVNINARDKNAVHALKSVE